MMKRVATIGATCMLALSLVACGDMIAEDPCQRFADLQETRGQLDTLDPATTTVADARALAEDLLDDLAAFEAAADGLYSQQIEDYEAALREIDQLMVDIDDDAVAEQWAPLMADSLVTSAAAFARLERVVEPACES
jgi:hypothetical protein